MSRRVYRRHCCATMSDCVHLRSCNRYHEDVDVAALREKLLVPHGCKCFDCGSTVVNADPLPHRCGPVFAHFETTLL